MRVKNMQNKLWKKVFVSSITILFLGLAITPVIMGNPMSLMKVYLTEFRDIKFLQNIPPIANFTYEPNEIMTDDLVFFNSTSYDPDGTIINWTWDFGDGNQAYDENATHTYSNNGNYEVNLTVIDNDSSIAFIVKNIFVGNQLPVTDFIYEPNEIMTDDLIYFNSTSYDPDGTIINWTWNFGDGNQAYDENVTHIYSSNGNYDVNLSILDNDNATTFIIKNIFVDNQPPIANFTYEPNEINAGELVFFNSTSYDPDGTIINWTWDFGDGTQAYDENTTHTYSDNGNYEVNLTITDNDNATAFIVKNIIAGNQPPNADFTFTPEYPFSNEIIYFTDNSTDPDGIIVTWQWDFGDGYYSNLQNPTHIYYKYGNFTVNLSVTDDEGSIDTVGKIVTVLPTNDPPYAPIVTGSDIVYSGRDYTFMYQSIDPDEDNIRFIVTWGDSTEDVSEFTQSNTPVILNHTWSIMVPIMMLRMTATAEDQKGAQSTLTEKWVIVIKSKSINSKNSVPTQKIYLINYVKTLVSILKNRVFRILILMFLYNHQNFFPIHHKMIQGSRLQ
jgi:PKD repeat protein